MRIPGLACHVDVRRNVSFDVHCLTRFASTRSRQIRRRKRPLRANVPIRYHEQYASESCQYSKSPRLCVKPANGRSKYARHEKNVHEHKSVIERYGEWVGKTAH